MALVYYIVLFRWFYTNLSLNYDITFRWIVLYICNYYSIFKVIINAHIFYYNIYNN